MVAGPQHMREYGGPCVIDRLDDVVGAVDVWSTYHLNVVVGNSGNLGNERGHILIDIVVQDCLDDKDVRKAVDILENAEVIHITVSVEVEVRNHVG